MVQDRRSTFVARWFHRGVKEPDPFDRFFSLWIALVVAAQSAGSFNSSDQKDREKILNYFRIKLAHVLEALEDSRIDLQALAKRRGTRRGDPIVDAAPQLSEKFAKLAAHYSVSPSLSERDLVDAVAELLNKIRNNVFHGVKVYDDHEDFDLLQHANPILVAILTRCENLRASLGQGARPE